MAFMACCRAQSEPCTLPCDKEGSLVEANNASRDVTLTVFMEGTANPMEMVTTQVALFSRLCIAEALEASEVQARNTAPGAYKLSFPGCGVSHGLRGTLFAHGLKQQVEVVHGYVDAFVKAGNTVKVNFFGLSRGGIGGLFLAQELAAFDSERLLLNLLLFDPVPGNLVWMARCDLAGLMNANQAMDVSHVENLGRVDVLYPYEPLPAIAFHAPLLAKYPQRCRLTQDVLLGCHQGALFLHPKPDTCLAFAMVRDFLEECGSELDLNRQVARELNLSPKKLVDLLTQELRRNTPSTRCTHAPTTGCLIVRRAQGRYLNQYHQSVLHRIGRAAPSVQDPQAPLYMLAVEAPDRGAPIAAAHSR